MNRILARVLGAATVVFCATVFFVGPVAAETTLVLSSWLPPKHPIVINAIKPWAKQVAEATEGRVKIRVLAKPLGKPPAHFDMAVEGVADITYGLHSFTRDERFAASRVGQFSFLGDDAVSASVAFWKVYTGDLGADAEHKGTKLLGLFVHGPGALHNGVRQIESAADLAGLKIRVPGGYINELMSGLGATTQFMSAGEVYEKLSRGVIDGVTFTMEALTAFKLTDDIKFTLTVPGGLYNTTWFVAMNQAKWDSLSPADQAAIEGVSGAAFAELVGAAWNKADEVAIAKIEKAGVKIHPASQTFLAEVSQRAKDLEAAWAAQMKNRGLDGAAALASFRSQTGAKVPE